MKSERNQKSRERKLEIRRTGNQISNFVVVNFVLCFFCEDFCTYDYTREPHVTLKPKVKRSKRALLEGGPNKTNKNDFIEISFSKWFDASFIILEAKDSPIHQL